MRFRRIIALVATLVCASSVALAWPRYDTNQDGVIDFADLLNALASGDFSLVNEVLTHWGQTVEPVTPGIDAKAIARWNVVPWQTFEGQFNVGVVAFHMNGIEKVSFSVNGAAWIDVTEKTLNPESGTYEYWIRLNAADYPDGLMEIRAIATPTLGVPRVLAGEIASATERSGEHSMFLSMNSRASLPAPVRFVSGVGSDETGDGTRDNPFRTPYFALQHIQRQAGSSVVDACDGAIIYCLPGEYEWGRAATPYPRTLKRWATITPAPGVRREDVVFTSLGPNGFTTRLIAAHNISTSGAMMFRSAGAEKYLWVQSCDIRGEGRHIDRSPLAGHVWSGMWVLDTTISDVRDACQHATLARNVRASTISCDAFSMSRLVVNSAVHDIDNTGTPFHADVYQIKGGSNVDNHIVYGLEATAITAQGIFARGPERVDNVAFVNVLLERSPELEGSGRSCQWMDVATNHLLLYNLSMPNYTFAWRTSRLRNVAVRGTIFHKMSVGVDSHGVRGEIRDDWFEDNHFIDTTSFGARTAGIGVTSGDPWFVDPGSLDYRPAADSPLISRTPRLSPIDTTHAPRPPLSSVGAYEP